MYLSKQFLNSIITGFGVTSGTLISLHLYALIFNEEINNFDKNNEENKEENKEQNKEQKIDNENLKEMEEANTENDEENIWILCRILRNFFSYHYYI